MGIALGYLLEHGALHIQDYQALYPQVNRRTLQRDLQKMAEQGLLTRHGNTRKLTYQLSEKAE